MKRLLLFVTLLFNFSNCNDKTDWIQQTPRVIGLAPQTGVVGSTVTIDGVNFSPILAENIVMFGDAFARITEASTTALIVTVPAGTGEVAVSVTVKKLQAEYKPSFTYQDDVLTHGSGNILMKKLQNFPIAVIDEPNTFAVASFSVLGKGYVCDSNGKFYEYDPSNNTWTPKADYPETIDGLLAFGLNDRGYLGYGGNSVRNFSTNLYEYDPQKNSWTGLSNPSSPLAWWEPSGHFFISNNKIYFNNGPFEKYYGGVIDIGKSITWTQKTSYPGGRSSGAISFSIEGKAYVGGGDAYGSSTFWLYDVSLNNWTQLKDIPKEINPTKHDFVINSRGYAVDDQSCWSYDPNDDRWDKQDMPIMLKRAATIFTIGDTAYFLFTDGSFYSFNVKQ